MTKTIRRIEAQIPITTRKKRVAAYARVSLDTERLENSLSAQISYYSAFIQRNPSWEYAGVFADNGISGTSTDRTEFQRLMAECEAFADCESSALRYNSKRSTSTRSVTRASCC